MTDSNRNYKVNVKGFTIVELLVVIVVIGVLAAISLVSYSGISQRASIATLQSDLTSSANLLKMYYAEYGVYPQAPLDGSNCPTAPTANSRYCLRASQSVVYQYSNPSPSTFALQVTLGSLVYAINENSKPTPVAPITAIASIAGEVGTGGSALAGGLTPSDATVSYQWQIASTSGGTYTDIPGATSSSYSPLAGDLGKYLKVRASGNGFSSGVVTSAASSAIVAYAANGSYYLSSDGSLRAGANLAASGATYGTIFTEYWSESTGWWGGDPSYAKLPNNRGIHLYRDTGPHMLFDTSYLLQNNMLFKPSSVVNIFIPGNIMTDSGWDPDDGNYQNWDTPVGVAGSYITVQ